MAPLLYPIDQRRCNEKSRAADAVSDNERDDGGIRGQVEEFPYIQAIRSQNLPSVEGGTFPRGKSIEATPLHRRVKCNGLKIRKDIFCKVRKLPFFRNISPIVNNNESVDEERKERRNFINILPVPNKMSRLSFLWWFFFVSSLSHVLFSTV